MTRGGRALLGRHRQRGLPARRQPTQRPRAPTTGDRSATGARPTCGRCSPPSACSSSARRCRSGGASPSCCTATRAPRTIGWPTWCWPSRSCWRARRCCSRVRQLRRDASTFDSDVLEYALRDVGSDGAGRVRRGQRRAGRHRHRVPRHPAAQLTGDVRVGRASARSWSGAARRGGGDPDQPQSGVPHRRGRAAADCSRRCATSWPASPRSPRSAFCAPNSSGPSRFSSSPASTWWATPWSRRSPDVARARASVRGGRALRRARPC